MRGSCFTGIFFLAAILMILSGCGKPAPVHEGTEECLLLHADREMGKTDGVVMFNTHNGAIVDVLHSPGKKNAETVSNRIIVCPDKGSIIHIITYGTHGISQINCNLNENSRMDYDSFEELFCPECRKNIYHDEGIYEADEKEFYDIALLDRKTGIIYPITDTVQSYFIRDFYVHILSADTDSINFLLVYAPAD